MTDRRQSWANQARRARPAMRPETIARRAAEHAAEREARHAALVADMTRLAAGALSPDDPRAYLDAASFWRDLLADHRASCERCTAGLEDR